MITTRFVVSMFSVSVTVLSADVVTGQDYPNKPIRIVTGSSGSGVDFTARLVAQGIASSLGQLAIVENRPSGVIPGETVSKAAPDGYTLLIYSGSLWIGSLLQKKPYDPVRDFLPIGLVTKSPNLLIVHPSLPVASVKDVIALAKARPGALNYSSGSAAGGSSHLAAELFKSMAGVNVVRIPYKSASVQMTDLISGYVQLTFDGASLLMPHVKSGKLRALAVTSAEPSLLAPGLPTVAATVPGYESASMFAMFAPAGTSVTIINRLNQELVRVLNRAETKDKFFDAGVEPVGSSPEQLATTMKSEITRLGKVIKDAGIRLEH